MKKALAVLCLTACATAPRSDAPPTWSDAPTAPVTAAPTKKTAEQLAKEFTSAEQCERGARQVYAENAPQGWALLVACVKKGDFILLKPLLEDPWDKELSKHKTGAQLLASVIVMRGGDVESDLALLHEKRFPIFSLPAAMAEPDQYVGRLVVVRGQVQERKTDKGRLALLVGETTVEGGVDDKQLGPKSYYNNEGSVSGRYNSRSSTYGTSSGEGSAEWKSRSTWGQTVDVNKNVVVGTGRRMVLLLDKPDPFLTANDEFVFLVRFEGVRPLDDATEVSDDLPTEEALATVLSYVKPRPRIAF